MEESAILARRAILSGKPDLPEITARGLENVFSSDHAYQLFSFDSGIRSVGPVGA